MLKVENHNGIQCNFDIMRIYTIYKNGPPKKCSLYPEMVEMHNCQNCPLVSNYVYHNRAPSLKKFDVVIAEYRYDLVYSRVRFLRFPA
jgi:hypothetical protein